MNTLRIETETAVFDVFPARALVLTSYDDHHRCWGERENNGQNVREAISQGYKGEPDAIIWRSLVEHELLHSVVAEMLWGTRSRVLSTEAGLSFVPSWLRYEEEAIALAFQAWLNGTLGDRGGPLTLGVLQRLAPVWQMRYAPQLAGLWE